MATATKSADIWTDYLLLEASRSDDVWKIQINQDQRLRCSCKSFIFCRVTPAEGKHCKHTKRAYREMENDRRNGALTLARDWFAAMVNSAELATGDMVRLGDDVINQMTRTLAGRLASMTTVPVTLPPVFVEGRLRSIRFDDDE